MVRPVIAGAGVLAALLAGCAVTRQESFTIAGGERVTVAVEHGWPTPLRGSAMLPAEGGAFRVEEAGLYRAGSPAGALAYAFRVRIRDGASLAAVRIDDVTSDPAELLLADATPAISGGEWAGNAPPRGSGDPGLRWLATAGDSVRIYRFTLGAATGAPTILYQPVTHSGSYKRFLRDGPQP